MAVVLLGGAEQPARKTMGKLQAPSASNQRSTNFQAPERYHISPHELTSLGFGIWGFSGVWILVLGAFSLCPSRFIIANVREKLIAPCRACGRVRSTLRPVRPPDPPWIRRAKLLR